jgi:hypothetical protein
MQQILETEAFKLTEGRMDTEIWKTKEEALWWAKYNALAELKSVGWTRRDIMDILEHSKKIIDILLAT